jgi:phosphoribosylanthranilate isomerase
MRAFRPPFVKVCCIADPAEARLAISAGAAALGLVSTMPSGPGVISEARIAEIAALVPPPVATFLLTAETSAPLILAQHRRCGTSVLQFVDRVPQADLRLLREALPGIRLVQVVHVTGPDSVGEALAVAPLVDALLLDSGNPALAVKELGGTGRTHDWSLSRRIREEARKPVFLAGGLSAANLEEALSLVEPFGVDVCSGVRTGGRLDPAKLAAFLLVAQGA